MTLDQIYCVTGGFILGIAVSHLISQVYVDVFALLVYAAACLTIPLMQNDRAEQ